jgi:hypothetical protein
MPKRSHGVLLVLTLLVAAGALVQAWRLSVALDREAAESLSRERDLSAIETNLANLRAAQAGYVATGLASATPMSRAASVSAEIHTALGRLRATADDPVVQSQYDAAASALKELGNLDTRARTYVSSDRPYEASDVIFVESQGPVQRLTSALADVRAGERQRASQRSLLIRRLQLAVAGGAIVFLMAVVVFFRRATVHAWTAGASAAATTVAQAIEPERSIAPSPRPAAARPAGQPAGAAMTRSSPAPAPAVSASVSGPAVSSARTGNGASAMNINPAGAKTTPISLDQAAELCVDLARVIDARDVPALLERAAGVLGAKGAVLWVADDTHATLRPSFACGYSDRVLSKLSGLKVDADNVTSLAYRSMRAQAIGATAPSTRGAIAVPLVTSTGCVGVLSAEIDESTPSADTLAVARMIAAQVAALVGPADAAGPATAAGG